MRSCLNTLYILVLSTDKGNGVVCRGQCTEMADSPKHLCRRDSALEMHDGTSKDPKLPKGLGSQRYQSSRTSPTTSYRSTTQSCKKSKHGFMSSKGVSWFKRLASVPCKRLFSRSGAEVHDSSGLEQAVSMYLYAAGHPPYPPAP